MEQSAPLVLVIDVFMFILGEVGLRHSKWQWVIVICREYQAILQLTANNNSRRLYMSPSSQQHAGPGDKELDW